MSIVKSNQIASAISPLYTHPKKLSNLRLYLCFCTCNFLAYML